MLATLLLAAAGCSDDTDNSFGIDISLSDDPVTQGVTEARFALTGADGIDSARLLIDGKPAGELAGLDGGFWLSVTELSDGNHELTVEAVSEGRPGSGSKSFTVRNPGGRLTTFAAPAAVAAGDTLSVSLAVTGSVERVWAAPGAFAPGISAVEATQVGERDWQFDFTVPATASATLGLEPWRVFIVDDEGRALRVDDIRVRFLSGPTLPIRADFASIEYGAFPAASSDGSLAQATGLTGHASVIPGGEARLSLTVSGDMQDAQVLVGIEGFDGVLSYSWDQLTANPAGAPVRPGIPLAPSGDAVLSFFLPPGAVPNDVRGQWPLRVAVRDRDGNISEAIAHTLNYADAEDGELRVTLSWDTPTDVDLYVVNPDGQEIYYGSRSDSLGGQLDLDSNAGCSIDGTNQENIHWPKGKNGEYVVRVNYWSACGDSESGGLPANWSVTVSGCGVEESASGSLGPGDASGGGAGAGAEVLRIQAECADYRVFGIARYQRLVGAQAVQEWVAAEGVPVQVVDKLDNLLGEGIVGPGGKYDVTYDAPEVDPEAAEDDKKVFLRLAAMSKTVEVRNHGEEPNIWESAAWLPEDEPEYELDVNVPVDEGSGAFNILRVAQKTVGWYASKGYAIATPLQIRWEYGFDSVVCASCYSPSTNRVQLAGSDVDDDAFDDPIITHEIGHLAHRAFGRNDSPGGSHSTRSRSVATLAWSEGLATWLGQRVLDDPMYWDRTVRGMYAKRIDDLTGVPLGTANGQPWGDHSEATVYAALWDFWDPVSTTEHDNISGLDYTVLRIAFPTMKEAGNLKFGYTNAADFADFVGLLACPMTDVGKNKVHDLLNARFRFPWVKMAGFCDALPTP
jgi:hypothetical protein